MAYRPLSVDAQTPRMVRDFIRVHLDMQFHDVHCMLRLPLPEHDLYAGCNFAAANTLLSLVSGCSVTLYHQGSQPRKSGEFFRGVLREFYPWDFEPPEGAAKEDSISLLYYQFRNPLAHAFGVQEANQNNLVLTIGKGNHREADIEALEQPTNRPTGLPTIAATGGSTTLIVEGLYCGVREMVCRLTADKKRMNATERYLKGVLA
jgi:hypothetical protein